MEVTALVVYNESSPPPFDINDRNSASEDHRLKYRYLELRTQEMQYNMIIRHKTSIVIRNFMNEYNPWINSNYGPTYNYISCMPELDLA